MAQNTRAAKRARVQVEEPASRQDPMEHDDEYWFDDGNVILVAQNKGFRIYRGLLAAQSSVFADMFTASSPDATESHEGCPVVELSDTPEDLRDLLRVLLPKSRRVYHEQAHDHPFEEVLAIIRMANKYAIDDIEEQALEWVRGSYPSTYEQYANLATEPAWEEAIAVVSIARLTDEVSMLPLALYRCCCLGGDLVDGWKRRDGTVERLSMEDLKLCFSGRDRIAREVVSYVARIFSNQPGRYCTHGGECVDGLDNIRRNALEHEDAGGCHILASWEDFIETSAAEEGICGPCMNELKARHAEEREQLWEQLPDLFGLEIDDWV